MQADLVKVVPCGHVSRDDSVALLEAVQDFNHVHGGSAKFSDDAHCALAVVYNF
jgi:hypothetical protein